MKKIFYLITAVLVVIFNACEKNTTNDLIETPIEEPKPVISIYPAREISDTSVVLKSSIVELSEYRDFGFIISSTNNAPVIDGDDCIDYKIYKSLSDTFSIGINNLKQETTYYYTSYVYTDKGYWYGDVSNFSTHGFVTDINGNIYRTVKIGEQWWMAENLKATHFNDGEQIPNITDSHEWKIDTLGAYCWYDNDIDFKEMSGALYNWYAVNTGKLSPSGWHVASFDDWTQLISFVEMEGLDGNALKAKTGWFDLVQEPYNLGTDIYGFSALPGGWRLSNPETFVSFFMNNECTAIWWANDKGVQQQYINSNTSIIRPYKFEGLSVRCVKN